ncbi:MAG TPA: hypothetical protein VMV33_17005 [Rhodocyclaceae bacterium]|nr:hypothetical protein [Rhodocyclaceae bacterium]
MKNAYAMMLLGAAAAGFAGSAIAAPTEATVAYTMANQRAAVDYKVARAKCNNFAGNLRAVCVAEARSARIHVEANAKAQYKSSLSARTDAREAIADADYDVDKARCVSKTGNAEEVCIKEAKAALVAAVADAKADKKVIEARADARDDKQTADYKVALEKCDSLAGAAKDACVMSARYQFDK